MCKVSVVVPVYNAEKYLRECLESIRNQSLKDIQIIVVDDGSTDRSVEIIDEYINMDSRFILIKQKNQFAGVARNNGMKKACGEYICFLDADDFFEITMLEEMYQKAKQNDADIVLCNAYFFDNITKETHEPSWILRTEYIPVNTSVFSYQNVPDRIFQITIAVPWNKMYKKSFVNKSDIKFQHTQKCNDEYFVNMSLVLADRICVIDNRLVKYRINNINSLQGMGDPKEVSFDFYKALLAIQNDLIDKGLYKFIDKSFINKCLSGCLATLNKQRYFDNFSKIYQLLKEDAFTKLSISNHNKSFFYSNFDVYEKITKYSPEEFVFQEYLLCKKSQGESYAFPYDKLDGSRNIAIYGAGKVGKAFWRQITSNNYYHLVAWFDAKFYLYQKIGLPVMDIVYIKNYKFEKIIIAIEDVNVAESVYKYLKEQKVNENKIIYGV